MMLRLNIGDSLYGFFHFGLEKKSEGQWYCQTIPENFICYFQDTKSTLIYL